MKDLYSLMELVERVYGSEWKIKFTGKGWVEKLVKDLMTMILSADCITEFFDVGTYDKAEFLEEGYCKKVEDMILEILRKC